MAGSAATEARVLTEARAALRKLIDAGDHGTTGVGLLGDSYRGRWGSAFLGRLEVLGLVVRGTQPLQGAPGRRPAIFVAVDRDELQALLTDDEHLATIIWPASGLSVVREPEPEPEQNVEPEVSAVPVMTETTSQAAALEAMLSELPQDQILPTLLKICSVTLENVVYMRERVDKLSGELADLRKAWE